MANSSMALPSWMALTLVRILANVHVLRLPARWSDEGAHHCTACVNLQSRCAQLSIARIPVAAATRSLRRRADGYLAKALLF
jgi:hypothetical protein